MTPAIASLVPEIAPAPATTDAAATAGDAARFGAALEQAMLAAQAGQPKGSEPAAPPMLMLLLADLPADADGQVMGEADAAPDAQRPVATTDAVTTEIAAHAPMLRDAADGPNALLPQATAPADQSMPLGTHRTAQSAVAMPSADAAATPCALDPKAMGETTDRPRTSDEAPVVATGQTARVGEDRSAGRAGAVADDDAVRPITTKQPGASADATDADDRADAASDVRSRRRSERTPSATDAAVAEATAVSSQVPPQALAQVVPSPMPQPVQPDGAESAAAGGDETSRLPRGIEGERTDARREQRTTGRTDVQSGTTPSHGLGAAREADETRTAVAIAQAAGLDPSAPDAASGALPAGVRVLDLHVQAARRQHLVANGKRTTAPRTGEEAAAALDIAAAPQAPGAEALDRLRWPTVTPLPRESKTPVATTETLLPTLQATASTESAAKSEVTSPAAATTELATAFSAGQAARTDTPSHDERREGRGKDDAPVALFAPTVPATTSSARGEAPAVPAAPATTAAAPAELAPRAGGIERISVRLGDGEGAPTVRIAIWQGNVDAKIVTSDAQLARDLGRGAQELASALESRGFDAAQVRVRGTPSANEVMGPAQLAGSAMTESRQPEQSSQQDGRRSHEERAQAWRDERPEQRQQGRQPRRPRRDDDETEA